MKNVNRRRFLKLAALSTAVGSASYAAFVEAWRLEVTWKSIHLGSSGTRIRLLHLADLHVHSDSTLAITEEAVRMGLEQKPDVICVTGDIVTYTPSDRSKLTGTLRCLSDAAPTYACLGNHDGGLWAKWNGGYETSGTIRSLLDEAGINCLYNESTAVAVNGAKFRFVGLGDSWAREMDPLQGFQEAEKEGEKTIVLCHNPDNKDVLETFPWKLMLAGHTHGGQVVIPLIGYAPFLPVRDERYDQGLKAWGTRWIHITRGVGSIFGLRFNCRPEVSMIEVEI
jgi:uncharacterized protein